MHDVFFFFLKFQFQLCNVSLETKSPKKQEKIQYIFKNNFAFDEPIVWPCGYFLVLQHYLKVY